MLNLVGQIAIVAAIDLACAQASAQTLHRPELAYPFFAAVLVGHGLLNATSVRLVAWLNDASATVHVVGVAILAGVLMARGRTHGVAYLAERGADETGFVRSLVLGVWTFTGFDAAAHVSEETVDPTRRAPVGIVSSVAVSAVAGFALVAALTLAIPAFPPVAGTPDAALTILRSSLGDTAGACAMALAILAMWFAGLSSVTSASRMLFAFARDGGIPWARTLRRVDPRTRTPLAATVVCVAAPAALVAGTAPLSEAVFLAVAALATVALNASYALPIALGAIARLRRRWTRLGPFNLGSFGVAFAALAVAWTFFVLVVCTLANGLGMEIFLLLLAGLAALWLALVRGKFSGPKVDLAHFEGSPPD
jgi:amino acid transporter